MSRKYLTQVTACVILLSVTNPPTTKMNYPEVTSFDVVLHAMLYLVGGSAVVCFVTIGILEYLI